MYSLNNIPFSNYGITPGRAEASNIAVSGFMDMPERIGKTFHDWTGEPGVEPYVLASEIRHGGRSISFTGLMEGNPESFYREIDSYKNLVPLVTPWSNHQVFIQDKIEIEKLQAGWNKISIKFEEPIVPNSGIAPPSEAGGLDKPHIDGVALETLGMFLSGFKDHLNRAKTKQQEFTAYENPGYQITPPEALEFELDLVAYATSFEALKGNIQSLHKLLSMPGMRKIKVDSSLREVFNVGGFKVSNIKVTTGFAVCRITLPLMQSKPAPLQTGYLLDNNYNNIVSNLEELIQI